MQAITKLLDTRAVVQQLATRLQFFNAYGPALDVFADDASALEVDPTGCATLPSVNLLWGGEASRPLASLLCPEPDHDTQARLWNAALLPLLTGRNSPTLSKEVWAMPPDLTQWARTLTGLDKRHLSRCPKSVMLLVASHYATESWCFRDDGIEFLAPRRAHFAVRAREATLTDFDGAMFGPVRSYLSISSQGLPKLPEVQTPSVTRALMEQGLFIDDLHCLWLAHLLELKGLSQRQIGQWLAETPPGRPERSTTELLMAGVTRGAIPIHRLLGLQDTVFVDCVPLYRQLPELVFATEPQLVNVAAMYRDVVEDRRLMGSYKFRFLVERTVPLADWLQPAEIPIRTLRSWSRYFGEVPY